MIEYQDIHIGNKIKSYLKKEGISANSLAKQLGKATSSVHDILSRKDIHPKNLREISIVLEHDFFFEYLPVVTQQESLKPGLVKRLEIAVGDIQVLHKILEDKQEQFKKLQIENELMRELLDNSKK